MLNLKPKNITQRYKGLLYFPTYIFETNMYYVKGQQLKLLNSKEYGLSSRTVIGEANDGQLFLIKDRQSRIIMKDGKKILEQINNIKICANADSVMLATQAPICGKTTKFFKENEIKAVALEK